MTSSKSRRSTLFWAATVLAMVAAVLVVASAHVGHEGERALVRSDAALAAGDPVTAIAEARDAAMSLAPSSPVSDQGFARLDALAAAAETRGDFDEATLAWRAIRAAIVATRRESELAARLTRANAALVRLATRVCEQTQARPPANCTSAATATLAQDDLPSLAKMTGLGVSALAFLGGGAALLFVGRPRRRVAWALVAGLGAAVAALLLATR